MTGSGKTEVYLHIIESVLAKDPQAQVMLLVPEINLTPQLEARVRARFAQATVVTMHSSLTPAQRARNWLAVHEGRARILVGTRMAVLRAFKNFRSSSSTKSTTRATRLERGCGFQLAT